MVGGPGREGFGGRQLGLGSRDTPTSELMLKDAAMQAVQAVVQSSSRSTTCMDKHTHTHTHTTVGAVDCEGHLR